MIIVCYIAELGYVKDVYFMHNLQEFYTALDMLGYITMT